MSVSPAKHSYAWLPRKCDWQTERRTNRMDGQTDTEQSDPYVPLCFAGDTKSMSNFKAKSLGQKLWYVLKGMKTLLRLVVWLVVLRIYVASAVFKPYRDLEAGDNQSLKVQVARPRTNPSPLAPQAKSLTTRPTLLPRHYLGVYFHLENMVHVKMLEKLVKLQGYCHFFVRAEADIGNSSWWAIP